jgi:excisionase family DNA binding protein
MDGETLLLKAKEAAAKLQISPRTLWALTKQGAVPCVRIGRAVRYRVEDLAAFVQGLESKPTG